MNADLISELPGRPFYGPDPYTYEWYAIRLFDPDREKHKVVFGASEAAAVCNQDPYTIPLQIYLEKRGEVPPREFTPEQQKRMDIGKRFEPIILDVYEEEEGCKVIRNIPMLIHKDYDFMAATPDGVVAQAESPPRGVDSKASNFRMIDNTGEDDDKFGVEGTDEVPRYIFFQAQQQAAVMGVDRIDFPVLIDSREIRIYRVNRIDELVTQLVDAEQELAERIINGDPPEPNWDHKGTRDAINRMFGESTGDVVTLGLDSLKKWEKREKIKSLMKKLEGKEQALMNELLWEVGKAEFAEFPGADFRVKRVVVKDSILTERKIDELRAKVGTVSRKGSVRLQRSKIGGK